MNKNAVVWVLICIGVALLGYIAWSHMHRSQEAATTQPRQEPGHYESEHIGLMFVYPTRYEVESRHEGEGHVLTLLPKGYTPPTNGEGPAAITVQEFINAEGLPLNTFIRNEPRANFSLSGGTMTEARVGGQPALMYTYSGLYENDAYAVAANGKVYVFATGWTSQDDPLRQELKDLIQTVSFINDDHEGHEH